MQAVEIYRHVKTGGFYRLEGRACIEATVEQVVIYSSMRDGAWWVRPATEFDDGRFERIEPWPSHHPLNSAIQRIVTECHGASRKAGWWNDLHSGEPIINRPHIIGEKLMLIVSEIAEAMEGHRKNLRDDKLPDRPMIEVELADALIRIADLAGAMQLDLAGAVTEKMAFNAVRPDHQHQHRVQPGGKKY